MLPDVLAVYAGMTATRTNARAWWVGEDAVALHAVPALLPPRTTGKLVSVATVYRWTTAGVFNVRLRRFRAAARGWATTKQELARWQQTISAICGEGQ